MYSDRPRVNPVQSLNVLVSFYVSFVLVRVARRNLGNPSGTKCQMNEKGGKKTPGEQFVSIFGALKFQLKPLLTDEGGCNIQHLPGNSSS